MSRDIFRWIRSRRSRKRIASSSGVSNGWNSDFGNRVATRNRRRWTNSNLYGNRRNNRKNQSGEDGLDCDSRVSPAGGDAHSGGAAKGSMEFQRRRAGAVAAFRGGGKGGRAGARRLRWQRHGGLCAVGGGGTRRASLPALAHAGGTQAVSQWRSGAAHQVISSGGGAPARVRAH